MSTTLGAKSVGDSVYLNVNGVKTEFIVIHQGKPSDDFLSDSDDKVYDEVSYDDSCNGTWLLMKDIYSFTNWTDGSYSAYEGSKFNDYLNNTFYGLLDSAVKSKVKQAKIPVRPGDTNPLPVRCFLLSAWEAGGGKTMTNYSNYYLDGSRLTYFSYGYPGYTYKSGLIAYYNGEATNWAFRSYYKGSSSSGPICYARYDGVSTTTSRDASLGIRPAMVMDTSTVINDDGSVYTNTAPTTPSSISVPSNIMGGSTITISWGAASDADGNLAGYKVERSTNGGSSWSQIYQGAGTSTTNNVTYGTTSVMYRVKAYDDEGAESGYRTSGQVTVVNNTAPTTPASISVPATIKGGSSIVISWSASTDAEGNLSGYKLERSVAGGTWTQIYQGTGTSYTDAITKGWTTVAYRVRAYDPYTNSGYTTSATRTIDNNTAPTITCSYASGTNLGTKTAGFSISYTVNDVDSSDTVTVTEQLDGVTKRTFTATKGAANSFAVTGDYFQKILNGSHTMKITASDGKLSATYTLTFTKAVTKAVITLATPMTADAQITLCAISVTGNIPADASFKVEVTNNANDSSPVWEDCTSAAKSNKNHLFSNATAANGWAFNFRVTAERGSSGTSGYITSIQGGFQ